MFLISFMSELCAWCCEASVVLELGVSDKCHVRVAAWCCEVSGMSELGVSDY